MPIGKLARYLLFAALIGISILTYLREQDAPALRPVAEEVPIEKPRGQSSGENLAKGTGFDYYVLSLSWSPSYCAAEGARANRQQCDTGRPYGFLVHGLWPQYEQGYPQDCDTSQPRNVPFAQAKQLSDIMPSTGLVTYQWRKHGSCSGLTQRDYFATMRQAAKRVLIPSAYRQPNQRGPVNPQVLEQAFTAANPGMQKDGIAVTCDRDYLREVRICLTKDLNFRSCPEVDRSSCRSRSVDMPGAL
ncbi:ribonuclease T2 [Phyllobacterium sp. SB3]|uniref:ribonuclease T2 n=1 Tax=Phyllobacterium sp. SB3 TaxID=3156073 RepID=UPI0032AF6ACD